MADYIEIGQAIYNLQQEMAETRGRLQRLAFDYSAHEKAYNMALHKKTLELKAEGQAIGIIDKIVKGYEEVAKEKFDRDLAEAEYKAAKASLDSMKAEMSGLQSLYRNQEEV